MFQAWLLVTIIGQFFYKWKYVYMHGFERHKPTLYTSNPMVWYLLETTKNKQGLKHQSLSKDAIVLKWQGN
jgi:hypothetical protein